MRIFIQKLHCSNIFHTLDEGDWSSEMVLGTVTGFDLHLLPAYNADIPLNGTNAAFDTDARYKLNLF